MRYRVQFYPGFPRAPRFAGPRVSGDHTVVYDYWPRPRTLARCICRVCGMVWDEGGEYDTRCVPV